MKSRYNKGGNAVNIIKYPNADTVDKTISEGEPLLALISFDGKTAIMSDIDEAMEHHILLMKTGYSDGDIDKYFRIVFSTEEADWTFICPPNYKNISDKRRRIAEFYKDGFYRISDFLAEINVMVGINILKRYHRHLDYLKE